MKIKELLEKFIDELGTVDIMNKSCEILCSLDCKGMPYSECLNKDFIKFPDEYSKYADMEVKEFSISMVKMIPSTYPEYELDIYIEEKEDET